MPVIVNATQIVKNHLLKSDIIPILKGVNLKVENGHYLAVMGASGSGKSTLLHILGCLDRPTSGNYHLAGVDVLSADDNQLSNIRGRYIGFVFQTFNLIDTYTVAENVALPLQYQNVGKAEMERRVHDTIEQVGLSDRIRHCPAELSGGEMQRVAIARALVMNPKLILADEPTGNLDSKSTKEIMQLFETLHTAGSTIILVTHDQQIAERAQSRITLEDGQFINDDL